jgi:hypothetical protein
MTDQTGPDDEQGREGEDPRDVGMELLRHLGTLDDRLQRSQAQMLALLDRRRADLADPGPITGREDADDLATDGRDDPSVTDLTPTEVPAGTEVPAAAEVPAPSEIPSSEGVAAPAQPSGSAQPSAWVQDPPPAPAPAEAGTDTFGDGPFPWEQSHAQVGEQDPTGETPPVVAAPGPAMVHAPELERPAWQSNLITAAIAVAVLLVGLAFVGAL